MTDRKSLSLALEWLRGIPRQHPGLMIPEKEALAVAIRVIEKAMEPTVYLNEEPLYAYRAVAPSAFDPEAVAAAIQAIGKVRLPSYNDFEMGLCEGENNARRRLAQDIANRCLPADEREGWLRKCGVAS